MIDIGTLIETVNAGRTKGRISRRTLKRYQAAGLIPAPLVTTGPTGGRVGMYPDSAVDVLRQIKELRADGLSMDDVANRTLIRQQAFTSPPSIHDHLLGWTSRRSVSAFRKDPWIHDALKASEKKKVWSLHEVAVLLASADIPVRQASKVTRALRADGEVFAWTLTLFLGGYDPLLIVRQEDVYPTVPFMLAHEFGSRVAIAQVSDADGAPNAATTARRVDAITRPSLVIPISRYLTQALRSAGEATPTGQWFAPNTVYRMELDCAIEYRYAISESVDPRNAGRLAFSLDPRSGRTVFPFRPTAPDRAEYVASTEEGDDRVARRGPAS